MDDFNTPGSNKTWMDDGFKKFIVEHQLDNVVNILDAKYEKSNLQQMCEEQTHLSKKQNNQIYTV